MYMNQAKSCVAILFLALGVGGLFAADAVVSSDDLPPVPFIIGSDDSTSASPLMLPDDTASSEDADSVVASDPAPEYISQPAPQKASPVVAPINDVASDDISADVPPAPEAKTAPEAVPAAPVASTPAPETKAAPAAPTIATSEGLLPAYVLEQPHMPAQVVGHDGTVQMVGLEHKVGTQNPLLAPVVVSPAVATVGESFPELHVDQIPLQDLLVYLRDFTPKAIRYELTSPILVTVDLKAKSVEEVMAYLAGHYPLNITADAQNIYVRTGNGALQGIQAPAAPLTIPSAEPMPIISSEPTRGGLMTPNEVQPVAPAPLPTSVYYEDMAPAQPSSGAAATTSQWDDVHTKARLYELEKERQKLLDERVGLEQKTRKYQLERRKD